MSAYPFGGHPTFSEYLTWAAQVAKCKVQSGYQPSEDGKPHSMTRITATSGKHVIVADIDQNDRLVPTMVAHLDRRLGLTSPFAFPGSDDAE